MRLSRAFAAVLLVGASGTMVHADDDIPWYKKIFGSSASTRQVRAQKPSATPPQTKERIDTLLRDEEMRYLERLNYCSKLRTIAQQDPSHIDFTLLDQVEKLEEKAKQVYDLKNEKLKAKRDQAALAEEARPEPGVTRTAGIAQPPSAVKRAPNGRPIINKDPEGGDQ